MNIVVLLLFQPSIYLKVQQSFLYKFKKNGTFLPSNAVFSLIKKHLTVRCELDAQDLKNHILVVEYCTVKNWTGLFARNNFSFSRPGSIWDATISQKSKIAFYIKSDGLSFKVTSRTCYFYTENYDNPRSLQTFLLNLYKLWIKCWDITWVSPPTLTSPSCDVFMSQHVISNYGTSMKHHMIFHLSQRLLQHFHFYLLICGWIT